MPNNRAPEKAYSYAYPHPAVTTDIVLFTIRQESLQVLLIQRANPPFQQMWALPGGFLDMHEDLEQLYTFSAPDRDPRERVISVTYFALTQSDSLQPKAASDAQAAAWHPISQLPDLAFDHAGIIELARQRLAAKLNYSTIAFQLLPETFTLSQLQGVYETILDQQLDKRNFRKAILARNILNETGDYHRNGSHRPAKTYRVANPSLVEIIK